MTTTEMKAEGLRREVRVVVPQADVDAAVTARLKKLAREVKLPGFRPGKVPLNLMRTRFGDAVRGEVVENLVNERSRSALEEHGLRPALPPEFKADEDAEPGGDIAFTMNVDVMPDVPETDFAAISLTRLTAAVPDSTVDEALERLAETRRRFEAVDPPRPAADGDLVVVDYRGTVDGEERPGMAAEAAEITLGQGRMIPGFEEALTGLSPDEQKTFAVTFPDDYPNDLGGVEASFDVTVKEVRAPVDVPVDDDWAKEMGFEALDQIKDAIRDRRSEELGRAARFKVKRALLDRLAELHDFPVPERLVDADFQGIWAEIERALEQRRENPDAPADPSLDKPEDELRTEYRAIAERRVRLGLLLAEEGRRHNISVEEDDLQRGVLEEVRRMPGHEREVFEFYQGNEQALRQLRERLLEDKVVDFMLELVQVEEKEATPEEVLADPDEDAGPSPAASTD